MALCPTPNLSCSHKFPKWAQRGLIRRENGIIHPADGPQPQPGAGACPEAHSELVIISNATSEVLGFSVMLSRLLNPDLKTSKSLEIANSWDCLQIYLSLFQRLGSTNPALEHSGLAEEAPRRVWGLNPALGHPLWCPWVAAKHHWSILGQPRGVFCAQKCWNWAGEKLGGSSWDCPVLFLHPGSSLGAARCSLRGSQNLPHTISGEPVRAFREETPSSPLRDTPFPQPG